MRVNDGKAPGTNGNGNGHAHGVRQSRIGLLGAEGDVRTRRLDR